MINPENTVVVLTSKLAGLALDWAVAKCEGDLDLNTLGSGYNGIGIFYEAYTPSANWEQGGAILDRNGISTIRVDDDFGVDSDGFCNNVRIPVWCATGGHHQLTRSTEHQSHEAMFQICETDVAYGPTLLIAGMRCYVASKMGPEIQIPMSLWNDSMQVTPINPNSSPQKRNKP